MSGPGGQHERRGDVGMCGEAGQRVELQLRVGGDLAAAVARGHADGAAHERRDARGGRGGQAGRRQHQHVVAHADAAVGAADSRRIVGRGVVDVIRRSRHAFAANARQAAPATPTSSTSTRPACGSARRSSSLMPRVDVVTKARDSRGRRSRIDVGRVTGTRTTRSMRPSGAKRIRQPPSTCADHR